MRILSATLIISACLGVAASIAASDFGDCSGAVKAQFLEDGRRMKLLEKYVYSDVAGKLWMAPKDAIVDGASIPRFLWSLIGGPFEGKYRDASVVHDVACDERTDEWKAVHRMFYEVCRCRGVAPLKAKVMYAAVYHFGPRWDTLEMRLFAAADTQEAHEQFRRIAAYLQEYPNVPLDRVDTLTPQELERYAGTESDPDLREPNETEISRQKD